MKSLILALTLSLAMSANAKTVVQQTSNGDDFIIRPSVATAVVRYQIYTHSADGSSMMVCVLPSEHNYTRKGLLCDSPNAPSENNKGWISINDLVPKGVELVGFRTVSIGSGRYLEVFWKK
jgi:hypothetical protein